MKSEKEIKEAKNEFTPEETQFKETLKKLNDPRYSIEEAARIFNRAGISRISAADIYRVCSKDNYKKICYSIEELEKILSSKKLNEFAEEYYKKIKREFDEWDLKRDGKWNKPLPSDIMDNEYGRILPPIIIAFLKDDPKKMQEILDG